MAPRMFKQKIANFAPQFSGYNQHDSQVCVVAAKVVYCWSFFPFGFCLGLI